MKTGNRFTGLSKGRTAKRGMMNKTETRYAADLEIMKANGTIINYWFEPFSLRLSHAASGQPARYTPDFLLLYPDGRTVVVDVKGGMVDNAAIVRAKCAAELFSLWEFWIVQWKDKKWTTQEL